MGSLAASRRWRSRSALLYAKPRRSPVRPGPICGRTARRTRGGIVSTSLSFFFQAEDGIRATSVTGVQTCALPIFDLVERYELDGLHFDYVRYPAPDYDYSRVALERFRAWLVPTLADSVRVRFAELQPDRKSVV